MTLSQDEINKIHEEEAERARAQQKYNKPRKSIAGPGCLIFIIIAGLAIGISNCNNTQNRSQQSISQSPKARYAGDTHIDFKQDIDQQSSYYLNKLGEPEGGESYVDLPTYTNWLWQKDGFSFNVSFPKGSVNRFVDIQFEDGVCDQDSAYYFNKIGLDYPSEAPTIKNSGVMYRWEPYGEFDRLNVYCNASGTRIVLISQVE